MSFNKEEFLQSLDNMSIIELNELVKSIENKFDIDSSITAKSVISNSNTAKEKSGAVEKVEFDLILSSVGAQKVGVIKLVREITSLGLKEAKDLVDNAPKLVKDKISKDEAEAIQKRFQDIGAVVDIK